MAKEQSDWDETEDRYYPTWLDIPREFQDRRAVEAEKFNELITKHLHPSVRDWTCNEEGWKFELTDCTVVVTQNVAGSLAIHAVSDAMPRKWLDPIRAMLRQLLSNQDASACTPQQFAATLLQIVEETVAGIQNWLEPPPLRQSTFEQTESRGITLENSQFNYVGGRPRQAFDASSVRGYASVMDNGLGGE
jgi:hypothetical protein